jgi:ABC-type nitrate/sulfonate/bicarbonate transport system permease component
METLDDSVQDGRQPQTLYVREQSASGGIGKIAPKGDVDVIRVDIRSNTSGPTTLKASQPPRGTLLGRCKSGAWFILAWLLLGAIWELGAAQGWLNKRVLPPPSALLPYLVTGNLAAGLGEGQTTLGGAILDTMLRVSAGFLIGLFCALTSAVLIVTVRPARLLFFPIVQTVAPIAPVAWIPLAISVAGIGSGAAVLIVVLTIFGSVTASAVAAFDAVPREYIKVGRLLGAKRTRLLWRVVLPAAAPNLMTLARMSFFGAWMAVLAGEMAGINSGLGALIMFGQQQFNMRLVMIGIVAIGLLGFLVDRLLLVFQKRLLWWENRLDSRIHGRAADRF